jgi:pyocin large subunit-like protein
MKLTKIVLTGTAALGLLGLFACDNGPSAVSTRDRSATLASYDEAAPAEDRGYAPGAYSDRSSAKSSRYADRREDRAERPARRAGDLTAVGWAASKKYSAGENAAYHFERNGADFGASSVQAYVNKARAFVSHPPKGAQVLERRNGDRLFYDAKANVFAVASKDGLPRTMFKPRDGAAYWEQQKARENGRRTSRRDRTDGDDRQG